MEMEIVVPDEVPVMTLPQVVFFPQALLPLHIFEPRYRTMLVDVLAKDRLMAVVGLDPRRANEPEVFEPPHRVATVGIIRACQKNDNGTSNLLLQGLCRAEITHITSEHPYRTIAIRALHSETGDDPAQTQQLRHELSRLISLKQKFGNALPTEMTDFLGTVDDPDIYADLAAFNCCQNPVVKQRLLETLNVATRLQLFNRHLRGEIEQLQLRRDLQGDLSDNDIAQN